MIFTKREILYFCAFWNHLGKARATSFSAEKHGVLGALTLAMARRETGIGVKYDITPEEALNRMRRLLKTIDVAHSETREELHPAR